MKITSYKDLTVWQKAIELVLLIYQTTNTFPNSEEFGLKSQMRRSVVSVPSNIAEGRNRSSRKEFCQFLYIALGSIAELETQTEIAYKLHYVKESSYFLLNESPMKLQK